LPPLSVELTEELKGSLKPAVLDQAIGVEVDEITGGRLIRSSQNEWFMERPLAGGRADPGRTSADGRF
jgi:hypothetical protein